MTRIAGQQNLNVHTGGGDPSTWTLNYHQDRYSLSFGEGLLALFTLSGAPYALRHWHWASQGHENPWRHRLIAVLEIVPILGGIVAIIERIFVTLFTVSPVLAWPTGLPQSFVQPKLWENKPVWQPRVIKHEHALQKMFKNAKKAIVEHARIGRQHLYATVDQLFPMDRIDASQSPPLAFTFGKAEEQGVRPTMEDAYFHLETPDGVLAGVFDGHAREDYRDKGAEVSKYIADQLKLRFPLELKDAGGNVHQVFEQLFHSIDGEIFNRVDWRGIGSTAVVCYIDKETDLIYTATLGDSEANIYREIDGVVKSIPLTCIRNFSSEKDFARLQNAFPNTDLSRMARNGGKMLRSRGNRGGVNVARAFGDHEERTIISKPKITVNQVQPGDRLAIVCDGVKDYVHEEEVVGLIPQYGAPQEFADAMVDYALNRKKSRDNITALVIDVAVA